MVTIGGRAHTIQEIHEVAGLGLPFIEVSLDDPDTVSLWMPELIELKNTYGISYLAHLPNEDNPFDIAVLKERFVPKIKTLIDLSGRLAIGKATMHFWIDKRWAPNGLIPQKLVLLKEIVEYASKRGIVICIENLSERAESFQAAFEAIPDLRMTLDIGHAQLLARENTSYRFIEQCSSRIAHVHAHDNHGGTSVKDDLHLALGEGCVDYKVILSSLLQTGYDSTISMEVKPIDMPRTRKVLEGCMRLSGPS
ncbi:MAG TPA: sugar phosphate isomerase/epimerase [Desulfomonilia bacterium]|nr:sugar phosphate isomerase/epimerase [Desulfomonilia bacterium]